MNKTVPKVPRVTGYRLDGQSRHRGPYGWQSTVDAARSTPDSHTGPPSSSWTLDG